MSYYTAKKRDTVITDGSGNETEITPVNNSSGSNYTGKSGFSWLPTWSGTNYTGTKKNVETTAGNADSSLSSDGASALTNSSTTPNNTGSSGGTNSATQKSNYTGSNWLTNAISSGVNWFKNLVSNYTGKNASVSAEPEKVETSASTDVNATTVSNYTGSGTGDAAESVSETVEDSGSVGSNYTGANTTYEPSIEANRQSAYTEAEKERQRAIVDAHNAYETSKSNYGANAETLGNMGLAGSGYSDYMNSSAYATARGEVQQANAQSAYTKRVADETAAQEQSAYNDEITSIVYGVLDEIKDGKYTTDEVEQIIKDKNLGEDHATMLRNAASTYWADPAAAKSATVDTTSSDYQNNKAIVTSNASLATSASEIESAASSAGLTSDDTAQIVKNRQDSEFNTIYTALESGAGVEESYLNELVRNGLLRSEQVEQIKTLYNQNPGLSFTNTTVSADGTSVESTQMTKAEADAHLKEIEASTWLSEDTKAKYRAEHGRLYNYELITNAEVKFDGGNPDLAGGNNFKVAIDGVSYEVQASTSVPQDVKDSAKTVSNGSLFKNGGNIYYKHDDNNVVKLEKRYTDSNNANTGAGAGENFAALNNAINGNNEITLLKETLPNNTETGADNSVYGISNFKKNNNDFTIYLGGKGYLVKSSTSVPNTVKEELIKRGVNGIYKIGQSYYYKSGGNVVKIVENRIARYPFTDFISALGG